MMILMESQKHGRMHVYSNTEMETAVKAGWRVVADESEPTPEPVPETLPQLPHPLHPAYRPVHLPEHEPIEPEHAPIHEPEPEHQQVRRGRPPKS